MVYAFLSALGALFRSQLSLRVENVALRHQLAIYQRTVNRLDSLGCGRCTIAEVVEMDKSEYQQVIERLVRHFVDDLGAPTLEAAGAVAEEEAAYTTELCDSFSAGVWITVERTPGDDRIKEHYSVLKRLMIGSHKL